MYNAVPDEGISYKIVDISNESPYERMHKDSHYCSRMCQKRGWKRHRRACRPISEYNQNTGIIFIASRIPQQEDDYRSVIRTAFELIDNKKIHPNNFRIGGYDWKWEYCPLLFYMEEQTLSCNLLSLLKRGLNPQFVIDETLFDKALYKMGKSLNLMLEHGSDLILPRQECLDLAGWLLNKDANPNDIFSELSVAFDEMPYYPEITLRLADCGYNFRHLVRGNITIVQNIRAVNPDLADKVITACIRRKIFQETVLSCLIPNLVDICMKYYA